jgi:hypothetical protein
MLYVAVQYAHLSVDRAPGLGGTVIDEPFDVFDVGRMAVGSKEARSSSSSDRLDR